jgi:hypothetical protein
MSEVSQVACATHGPQPQTFVCQHIAESLSTRVAVGFHWPASSGDDPRPDAWCSECEKARISAGGEWVEELESQLSVRLLCGACYDEAKAIWAKYRESLGL